MKKQILIVLLILWGVVQSLLYAQVPPDSLVGYYVGEYWFRIENEPWDIRVDTINVVSINPDGCYIQYFDWNSNFNTKTFTTDYEYCFGTPFNWYTHFHSGDSITEVYDNYSTPPPEPELRSHRFYAKKAWITTVVVQGIVENKLMVYPNPADNWITIKGLGILKNNNNINYKILSPFGDIVKEGSLNTNIKVDVSELKSGVYLVIIETEKNKFIGKFVKL